MTWAMTEKSYSQRRACRPVGIDPRVHRYRSSRPDDVGLRARLRELAGERRRFGYRWLHLLVKREGIAVNWSFTGFTVKKASRCASVAGASVPLEPAPQWRSHRVRTRDGRWTSSPTACPAGGGSGLDT